ncbi:MAG: hypothetical protein M1358_03950 [Chloroflexi bacterium]|nr:hypothetical protein [Chloroflexota bacterium]
MPNDKLLNQAVVWNLIDPRGRELQAEARLEKGYPGRGDRNPVLIRGLVFSSRCHTMFAVHAWAYDGSVDEGLGKVKAMVERLIKDDAWAYGGSYEA